MAAFENARLNCIKTLTDCIINSVEETEFRWEKFFRLWFREKGNPLFFLFKKNLSVTNTQFVELLSLLTIHSATTIHGGQEIKLLFYSTEHIKTTFTEAILSLLENYNPNDLSRFARFSERYIDIFSSTVAVDMFYGSCAVFLPMTVKTDLEKIVSDSGYIHSAGKSVFVRNIKKAKQIDFLSSIGNYLANDKLDSSIGKAKIPFVVYSHEDFSGFDKDFLDLMDRGIDQCKIFVEKMSMGSERLSTIISEMSSRFSDRLFVPNAGDYRAEHKFHHTNTLWLISDKSISSGQLRNPGANRYYICYEQSLKNDSPFFFFDENKPAWKPHTTLPHSLSSALLNISRPLSENATICDPFGGTGTTWLEAKRIQLPNKVVCSDLSPSSHMLLEDNIHFFCMNSTDLNQLVENLKACSPDNIPRNQFQFDFANGVETIDHYTQAVRLIQGLKEEQQNEDQEFFLSKKLIDELKQLPFLRRVIFYITLRAELRFQGSFKRKSLSFETAFKKSRDKLIDQINMFIKLKKEIEDHLEIFPPERDVAYIKSLDTYSYTLIPALIFRNSDSLNEKIKEEIFSCKDARSLEDSAYDLIICDPPYGFNTSEDNSGLADLYSEFIDKAIRSLRPKGQLILCLPAESFTGRDLPYCTRSDLVSRQIIVKAHQQGRLVYTPARSIPLPSLSPPYYWESERALRRTILHFRLL